MAKVLSRRRAIVMLAAVAGLPLVGRVDATVRATTWSGQALGAPAQLILNHPDGAEAARLVQRVVAEVTRLEAVFSLYREDSALSELNRTGLLVAPPADLVAVLEQCRGYWEASRGRFDPTVQPLWALYRDHFSVPGHDPYGPPASDVARALGKVGFDRVRFNSDRIGMPRGTELTLNGIAQGFITDRAVEILREGGVTASLVDMGEPRAIGSRPDGTPWRIGLADRQSGSPTEAVVNLVNRAVATSSASSFLFDAAGRFGHIIDPRQGATPGVHKRVSVVASTATAADALSTAFSLCGLAELRAFAGARPDIVVDVTTTRGTRVRLGAPA